ncbi:hypothetical protein [Geothrix sp. SG200]|uniref:hypothetical protein n=1 Tax=Geothrix sp. SG200 TaxID=2922865 RepID=UPI001FAE0DCF|nr:hypothetical protein [Geothrix sp. SG200]
MAQWFVEILGDAFDLEEFPSNFRSGECVVVEQEGRTYLTGSAFQGIEDAALVRERAGHFLELQFGALRLLQSNLKRPQLGHVKRVHEDGRADAFVFPEGAQLRMKGSSLISTTVGGQAVPPGISVADSMVHGATANPHLERALRLWADPQRGWPQLYGVLEEVEYAIGQTVDKKGWASASQRGRFKQTANSAEAAGLKARHGLRRIEPPPMPMTIFEGTEFIHALLMRALQVDAG